MTISPRRIGRFLIAGALLALPACAPSTSGSAAPASPRVLIVGGGSSHDFPQWFQRADSTTLAATSVQATYTDDPGQVAGRLANADVLYFTANQPHPDPATRDAIFRHVASGKGLVIGHAGAWYNWSDWPEYNRALVGGGTRAHRRLGEFEVNVVAPTHPVMQGVPASFTIRDELYRFLPDTTGARIGEVLATAREVETGTVYPIVFTVQNPNARILVNTLGHDGDAHGHPAYQRILQNAVRWVSRQVR